MAPRRVPSRDPLACLVVRGAALDALGSAVDRLEPSPLSGPAASAVVLTRLSQPTPASPSVVHAVVDLLHDRGCDDVVVGASLRALDRDRGHLSIDELARQAGLTGLTPRGTSYAVVDLGADLVPAPVPDTSVLSGQRVSRQWAEAGTRVVVGRAVTELVDGYAACLATLLGAAPEVAGADPADLAADLLAHLPASAVGGRCTRRQRRPGRCPAAPPPRR